jgi:molybdate transport system permease protein
MTDLLTPIEIEALTLSLKVSFWAMLCSLPVAIGAAWLLSRCDFTGKMLVDVVVHLPLVLPPVVVGYLLLLLLGNQGPLGKFLQGWFGITVAFTWKGAAIASAVMAFPLVVRAIRLSLDGVDRRLESAARTLGAGPLNVFCTVTLPLIAPGILTGLVLGFARGLGEFGATITFVSNIPGETRTLPIALYTFAEIPNGEAAAFRLMVISIVVALAALAGSEFLARRIRTQIAGAS